MHLAPRLAFLSAAAFAAVVSFSAAPARAQDVPAPSPKAKVEQRVGLTDFALEYSSPGVKKRKIWGALVPFDKPWRTGANAPTKLTVSRDFTFGGTPVKAGSYALITIPGKTQWNVILSTNLAGGANQYDEKANVANVKIKPTAIPMRERLVFIFTDHSDGAVALDLEWEKLRVRIPITVDTQAHVKDAIAKSTGEAWRPHFVAARYLFDSGGDLTQALALIEKSIAIQPTWWNHWVKAQVLGKQGKKVEAVAAGEEAQKLGKGDQVFEGFFKADVEKAVAGWKKK